MFGLTTYPSLGSYLIVQTWSHQGAECPLCPLGCIRHDLQPYLGDSFELGLSAELSVDWDSEVSVSRPFTWVFRLITTI